MYIFLNFMPINKFSHLILTALFFIILSSCSQKDPTTGEIIRMEPNPDKRAREFADKNPLTLLGKDSNKNTNFEFSTSNVLWRSSLKTLDFIPLATVDYSGGIIITDWYSEGKSNKEQIKIQIRL